MKLFYATGAAADFIGAHHHWRAGTGDSVAHTFSGQIADFAQQAGATCLMVSGHPDGRQIEDGQFEIRHIPSRQANGLRWHIGFARRGLSLLRMAKEFGADVAVIDSGTMPLPFLEAFRRSGIRAVPVLHNTLYPLAGPSLADRITTPLTALALRRSPPISVSPAVRRQVGHGLEIRAQFNRDYFEQIDPPTFKRPFNVLFVGRVEEDKGVFDIVEAAKRCGPEVSWTICGDGSCLSDLRDAARDLPIDVRGFAGAAEQIDLRGRCQAVVVPTRSTFTEGLAMSAVEAILSHRPLITNPAVPALELLRPACLEHEPDDPASIADAALLLARDEAAWSSRVDACAALQEPFYDRRNGLTAALAKVCADL